MFTQKRPAYQSPFRESRVFTHGAHTVPLAAAPLAAASMSESSSICCIIGVIVFVMLVFYCLDKKFNIRRQSISSNIQQLRTNVNALKQDFENQVLSTNQTGAGKGECGAGINTNQGDDSMKVDLLPGNDCCCGDTTATHMPACGAESSKYVRSNFFSSNWNCPCIESNVMAYLSSRGGNHK